MKHTRVKKEQVRVLVTAAGCNTAISVMKGLRMSKKRTYFLVGVDGHEASEIPGTKFCDRVYTVPLFRDPQYIPTLLQICQKERIQAIIPIIDGEVEILAKNADLFAQKNVAVCASDAAIVAQCNDKYLTYTTLLKKHLATTPTWLPEELAKQKFSFPIFVKPRHGLSSQSIFKIHDAEELQFVLGRVEEPIIQPFLRGTQHVVDIVNTKQGKNIVAIPRHEIESKAGIGVKARTHSDTRVIAFAKRIAEALPIRGQANIEIMKDGRSLHLIEVNPRFSAGSITSTAAGVNVHELALEVFLGYPISRQARKWKTDMLMTRYWEEVFYLNKKIMLP